MNQLKNLRKERHISQADIAEELGIKPAAVSKYETGRVPLSEDSIIKLCDLLQVSADELLGISTSARSTPQESSVTSRVMGQIFPSSVTIEDYMSALLNTIAKQKKQMDQTIRNLSACGIPTATISRVTALSESEILALLHPNHNDGNSPDK